MTRRRRLLCVYQHAPTPGAPGIYRHRKLLAGLASRGWDVDLVSTPLNYMTGEYPERYRGRLYRREWIDGIAHHWVWASGDIHASKGRRALNYLTFASAAGTLGSMLARPDVVLVSSPPLSVGAIGPALSLVHRRPWILEVRDLWPESAASVGWIDEGSGLYRAVLWSARFLTSRAASVVVPTPGLVRPTLSHGARSVRVVTGALDAVTSDGHSRNAVRRELGVDDDTCLFLYLGSIGVANGLDSLVDAVAGLGADVPARFAVVGGGSARDELESLVAERAPDRLRFVNAVPKSSVPGYLAASDVCLHFLRDDPTFGSSLPTKVLEYLGASRPFVTNVRGLPARIAELSGGTFAPTVDDLRAAFTRWSAMTPSERRARGEQAYAYGRERFSLDAVVDRLESVLEDVIEGRAGGLAVPSPLEDDVC